MSRIRVGVIAALALLGGSGASAQTVMPMPLLHQQLGPRLALNVIGGRIAYAGNWPYVNFSRPADGAVEQMSYRPFGGAQALEYRRKTPDEEFLLQMKPDGRFCFRRSGTASSFVQVEFLQAPGEPIRLTLGRQEKQQVCQSPTFWHLMLVEPQKCQQHVVPVLEALRPQWQLPQAAATVERELLKMAASGKPSDWQQWGALVEQLGDNRFPKREAADRQLRMIGPRVIGYLRQLDPERLDAEQQFRIRRILRSLSRQTLDDTPDQAAFSLLDDPLVWLALLARPDASVRRAAAGRLATILGEPIGVDPVADPASQAGKREELRARIEKKPAREK